MHKVVIIFDQARAEVDFAVGTWTRALIDSAYRAMFRALPKHIAEIKRAEEKEKDDESGKRKSRTKSGE